MKVFVWCIVLGLAIAAAQAYAQASEGDLFITRGRVVAGQMRDLSRESLKKMSDAEALKLYKDYQEVTLGLVNVSYREAVMVQGGEASEAGLHRFLSSVGLAGLLSRPALQKLQWLDARLPAEEKDAITSELQKRYPAYDTTIRQMLVAEAIRSLSTPKLRVAEEYDKSQFLPAMQDPALLAPVLKHKGVRSASYSRGRYTVVFDERIRDGGVVQVWAAPVPDGGIEWKCGGSTLPANLLPTNCRD